VPARRRPTSSAPLLQLHLPLDGSAADPPAPRDGPPRSGEPVGAHGPADEPGGVATFVRNRRARHYVLRVMPGGAARVTIPRGGSRREAEAFLEAHGDWLARQRARMHGTAQPRASEWSIGHWILLRGERVRIGHEAAGVIVLGGERVPVDSRQPPRRGLVAFLRALATRELPTRVRELADRLALSPARVIVRDQQSRWGSCSPSGTISLNWRLVQMPPRVAEYVIVHELMHLQQPNHSRRFWRLVRRACPWTDEARAWLRRHGPELL
jgi:hypothetical protein